MNPIMLTSNFPGLKRLSSGKVRDIYEVNYPEHGDCLLMVTTDRISAHDWVLREGIPGKGQILTSFSLFWYEVVSDIIPNHLITANVDEYPPECAPYADQLRGRSMLVKKAEPLPVECITRGYLSGSGWNSYQKDGTVCGIKLLPGMQESGCLGTPLFTPSTKAAQGQHDENISFAQMAQLLENFELAPVVQRISLKIYLRAAKLAFDRGIIIADSKFELGLYNGQLILIDEVLTPDSSRFWPADQYQPGKSQPSFDKQPLRDWLTASGWDKKSPPPRLSQEIINKTAIKYADALYMLTGKSI